MSSTLARLPGLRAVDPLKITSCIDSPRNSEARDSPSTQRTASMMFDLPQPLGPTTPTSWPGSWKCVGSTNDLKPASLMEVRRMEEAVATPARRGQVLDTARKKRLVGGRDGGAMIASALPVSTANRHEEAGAHAPGQVSACARDA